MIIQLASSRLLKSITPNQHQNIIMIIINIHININNITTNQQLHIISHNSSKGENKSHYDKHHIQHLLIIHTSSYNHIKLFTKRFGSYPVLNINFNKVCLSFHNFKTTMAIESKLRKQTQLSQLCIHINNI